VRLRRFARYAVGIPCSNTPPSEPGCGSTQGSSLSVAHLSHIVVHCARPPASSPSLKAGQAPFAGRCRRQTLWSYPTRPIHACEGRRDRPEGADCLICRQPRDTERLSGSSKCRSPCSPSLPGAATSRPGRLSSCQGLPTLPWSPRRSCLCVRGPTWLLRSLLRRWRVARGRHSGALLVRGREGLHSGGFLRSLRGAA
jgi:hypothetical protein